MGGSERQQKLNIQQEVGYIKRGGSESQQKMNIQQEVGHAYKKKGGLGMIQPGKHEYQLSLRTTVVARMNSSYMQQRQ